MTPCDETLAELDAWLDGAVPPPVRARVELHLQQCDECRAIADDARVIRPLAAGLRPLRAPTDHWPAIRARIEGGVQREARTERPALRWLLAAALLIAASSLTTRALWVPPPPAAPVAVDPGEAGEAFASDVAAAATELEAAIALRRQSLDPETVEVVERNLAIIDAAIAETRAALAADPGDGRARGALVSAYNQKVRLLQAVLRTPSTRG